MIKRCSTLEVAPDRGDADTVGANGGHVSARAAETSMSPAEQALPTEAFVGRLAGPPPSVDADLVMVIGLPATAAPCVVPLWLTVRRLRRDRLISD